MGMPETSSSPASQLLAQYYAFVEPCTSFILTRLEQSCSAETQARLYQRPDLILELDKILVCYNQELERPKFDTESSNRSQTEVVYAVIDTLLRRTKRGKKNMLTLGYSRGNVRDTVSFVGSSEFHFVNDFPNSQVNTLKMGLWQDLLQIVGEKILTYLLSKTSCFVFIGHDSFYQLAGDCLGDLPVPRTTQKKRKVCSHASGDTTKKKLRVGKPKLFTNHDIIIVRSRLFYARPALNSRGQVTYGLRHIHILNRAAREVPSLRTEHLLMHIFPLQYGLHNVFTSLVDRTKTVQSLKDYTFRDDLLKGSFRRPKSLRNEIQQIVERLQAQHDRCSYVRLLDYYCPREAKQTNISVIDESNSSRQVQTQKLSLPEGESVETATAPNSSVMKWRKEIFTNFSNRPEAVSAFLAAILKQVLPTTLLGARNLEILIKTISKFIGLRRYESLTLQDFLHGLKVKEIPWLCPNHIALSLSETRKKEELLSELVYWIIDGLVLPLIRSHFYVTESHLFRNRVLYFRHDIWRLLTEPEISKIRLTMLCEISPKEAFEILNNRSLGFAYMRMLPKGSGARPITNLRRRGMSKDGRKQSACDHLLPSINNVLQSVYSIISYESRAKRSNLGFSIASISDIHTRLKDFHSRLRNLGYKGQLYFAKTDVKNCFDTIEQDKLMDIVSHALVEDEYMLQKFCAVVPSLGKIGRRFHTRAIPATDLENFEVFAQDYVKDHQHVVLVDGVTHTFQERQQVCALLHAHLTMHLIKIGKKFFRQETGIPQGSILSSLLCNMYYADMEAKTLNFMNRSDSVCFRLIDDFLYITPDLDSAKQFMDVMHGGNPEYGCFVSSEKSLVNFDVICYGERVPILDGSLEFPYCGTTINTSTLNVRKDFSRIPTLAVADTLTIDYGKNPGAALKSKIFQGLKLSSNALFIDTAFNSLYTVLINIYRSLIFAAMRFHVYMKAMSNASFRNKSYDLIMELTDLLFVFLKSRRKGYFPIQCSVTQGQVTWLGMHAFERVLRSRPAGYEFTLKRLTQALATAVQNTRDVKILLKVTRPDVVECFSEYVY